MKKMNYLGVYGVLIRNDKIVLIKKAKGAFIGKLDIPGGGIEFDEEPIETLKREVMEETGLDVINQKIFDSTSTKYVWEYKKSSFIYFHHIGIIYRIMAKGKLKHVPDGIDSNGANWYLISNLKRNDLTPFAIYSLEKLGYKLIDR